MRLPTSFTGAPVFFEPNSIDQLTFAMLICSSTFGVLLSVKPYAEPSDTVLAILCQVRQWQPHPPRITPLS